MKYIVFTTTVILILAAQAAIAMANSVTLRNSINVQGDEITFGDIFNGAGGKADYVLAPAPAPGKHTVFKASSVAFVARKHGLDWQPRRTIKRIKVSREGLRIPQQHILEELHFALEAELQTGQFELTLSTQHPNIQVAPTEDPTVSVESLSYSRKGDSFVAIVAAPAHSENSHNYKISGKIFRQAMVPVASHRLAAGAEIREQDLDYKLVRVAKIGRTTALDAEDIIGRSPRRSVRAGGSINLNNLGDPVTVEKGKLVSVTLSKGGINLAITGRTLEAGGEGDIIRVENITSRKTIQAQVINAQEVRIITANQRLAANQ